MTSPGSSGSVADSLATSGDGEDQVAGPGVLHLLAVDRAAEFEVVGVGELIQRDQAGPDRPETGQRLAQAELRRGGRRLQDAFGDVLPGRVAGQVGQGVVLAHLLGAAADDGDQLDFPVGVAAFGQGDVAAGPGDAAGELGEHGRLAGRDGEAGLGCVLAVVQADGQHLPRRRGG